MSRNPSLAMYTTSKSILATVFWPDGATCVISLYLAGSLFTSVLCSSGVNFFTIAVKRHVDQSTWNIFANGHLPDPFGLTSPPLVNVTGARTTVRVVKFICETKWGRACALHYLNLGFAN